MTAARAKTAKISPEPAAATRRSGAPVPKVGFKIAEGCNHRCTFCIIPALRGGLVSRPIGEVMQEAENLVKAGEFATVRVTRADTHDLWAEVA